MRKSINQCREAQHPLVELLNHYPELTEAMREHDVEINVVTAADKYINVGDYIAAAAGPDHEANMDRINAVISVLASGDGFFDWFNVDHEEDEEYSWMTF